MIVNPLQTQTAAGHRTADFAKRILIADDEPENLRLLGGLLKEHDYLIHVCTGGKDTLETAAAVRPGLILLDVIMPDLDGFEVCRRLKADVSTREIPVIFLTARNDRKTMIEGFQLGAVDYVTKPFDRLELLARVRTHTTLGRLTAGLREAVEERTLALDRANRRLRMLASELVYSEERERRRLACGLHDATMQKLAALQLGLDRLRGTCIRTGEAHQLDHPIQLAAETIQELRTLVFELSPPVLYELGLGSALEWLAHQAGQRWGIAFECRIEGDFRSVDTKSAIMLFQSVRELVTNVARHADAATARIVASRNRSGISITVEDDGRGFTPPSKEQQTSAEGGFGLFSIRQRLALLGGALIIDAGEGGSRITVELPEHHDQSNPGR